MMDLILLAFIVVLLILGYMHGFIREFFKLVAVIMGLYISVIYHFILIVPIEKAFGISKIVSNLVAFVAMFIIVYIIVSLLGFLALATSRKMKLTHLDRILGGLFGVLKAIFFIALVSIILRSLPFLNSFSDRLIKNSVVYKTICVVTQNLKLQKDFIRSLK